MLMDDGHIITGIRHYSPEMRTTLRRIYGKGIKLLWFWLKKPYHLRVKNQGFVDQYGIFVSRADAWYIAKSAGQIIREVSVPGELYSENLY